MRQHLLKKTTVASGAAGDFPSASGFYDLNEVKLLTVAVKQGAATAVTLTLLFADADGNTEFTLTKALAATSAQKLVNVGAVNKAGGSDLLAAGDDLAQAMVLPPKVRVSVSNAAVAKDVSVYGE